MFKNLSIFIIIASFGCFIYGLRHLFLEVEENACRMTYMFGVPQFSKVNFDVNSGFPHYGLYYYYEGRIQEDVNSLRLTGAPVIFIPGNAGSYKQVRSLASVALRKGMDNEKGIHFDYFTINYEEQLSGLYGGYLENQKLFLRIAINAVRRLYKKLYNIEKTVILIGHSMGGKVAQAVLQDPEVSKYINSIIFISSPLDDPVVNFDSKINKFYVLSNFFLSNKRVSHLPNRNTNVCTNYRDKIVQQRNESSILENIVMISIGGGNRDLLVRDGLTKSQYSDIHAMTSSIPNVWLSCDHLSAVWCLQLVTVINRFIFSISTVDDRRNVFFVNDKLHRVQMAINYFVKPLNKHNPNEVNLIKYPDISLWHEDSKAALRKTFKYGLRSEYNHLLPIDKYSIFKKVFIEIDSLNNFEDDWAYACSAKKMGEGVMKCERGIMLSHFTQTIASHDSYRNMMVVDIEHMQKFYSNWTHILVRMKPTNKEITMKIDSYKAKERVFTVKTPRLGYFKPKIIVNETVLGTIHYEMLIRGLEDSFTTLQVLIEPVACDEKEFGVTAKICIPWARGFERYKHLRYHSIDKSIYVNAPFSTPSGYNTSLNPISLELILNPNCRYRISYQFSIAGTSSKIVQEFCHWLPSHLVAVLFMVLRNQIVKFQSAGTMLIVKPYGGFFQCKSLYVVTGCRVLKKILSTLNFLPITTDPSNFTLYVGVVVHGTAIVLSLLAVFAVWTTLTFHGNIFYKIALRMTRISVPSSNVLMKVLSTLPLTFGVLFISISLGSCSGIGLILSFVFYFLMISEAYKDYLENWAWGKAKDLLKNVQQKLKDKNKHQSVESELDVQQNIIQRLEDVDDNITLFKNQTEDDSKTVDLFEGLQNFSFHITLLLLLAVSSALNFGLSIAWIKSHYYGHHLAEHLPDPFIVPTVVTLSCLSILLQLDAPHKSSGYRAVAVFLYVCVCACVLYCQENIYRLNYLIAFIFFIVTLQEILHRIVKIITKRS